MALPLALLAPVVLVVAIVAAEAAQPASYDQIARSVSTLAGRGATHPWIMTTGLLTVGVIYVLVAAGLRHLPTPARLLLGLAGTSVVVAAVAAQPAEGSSVVHMTSATIAWAAFVGWPLALTGSKSVDERLRWTSAAAGGVLIVLVAWFGVQLWTDGTWAGAAQRIVLVAQTVWPIRVAVWKPRKGEPGPGQPWESRPVSDDGGGRPCASPTS